jgi:hypothetical protein
MTRILEVEENGTLTLSAEILDNAPPHTRYVLETSGGQLTLRPEHEKSKSRPTSRKKRASSWEAWEKERDAVAAELSKIWPEGVSAADVISEMRR